MIFATISIAGLLAVVSTGFFASVLWREYRPTVAAVPSVSGTHGQLSGIHVDRGSSASSGIHVETIRKATGGVHIERIRDTPTGSVHVERVRDTISTVHVEQVRDVDTNHPDQYLKA